MLIRYSTRLSLGWGEEPVKSNPIGTPPLRLLLNANERLDPSRLNILFRLLGRAAMPPSPPTEAKGQEGSSLGGP